MLLVALSASEISLFMSVMVMGTSSPPYSLILSMRVSIPIGLNMSHIKVEFFVSTVMTKSGDTLLIQQVNLSIRAEVEDCLSCLFSLLLAPSLFLWLFLYGIIPLKKEKPSSCVGRKIKAYRKG